MKIEIIDDFLPEQRCIELDYILSRGPSKWDFKYHSDFGSYYLYFLVVSNGYHDNDFKFYFEPLFERLGIQLSQVWKLECHLYPGFTRRFHHESCSNYPVDYDLKTCLYFPHTTNAPTVFSLRDPTKLLRDKFPREKTKSIECKRNRALIFDGSIYHHSTSPTDSNYRTSVNLDWVEDITRLTEVPIYKITGGYNNPDYPIKNPPEGGF